MANTACSVKIPSITSAFISKEGNEILSSLKAPRYVDYINTLFGNVFKREYLDNSSFATLSDFTDDNNKLTVNGNLNNLYSKVRKELENTVSSPNFLNHVQDETIKNRTASEILKILENWKLFVDYHSKYNAYIAIRPEDLEEEKEINNYDKAGNEHSEFDLLTNEVRTAFKFLPKTQLIKNTSGVIVGVPVINPNDGLPVRADFEKVFKLTLDVLKNIKDEDQFIRKLTSDEILYKIPELYFFFDLLPVSPQTGTANFTNKQRRLFHQFFQVMSRDYVPVHASEMRLSKDKLPEHIRFASAKSNINKIEKQFVNNFISNQEENEYIKIENYIDEKNSENSVFGRRRLLSLPAKPKLIEISADNISSLSVRRIKSDFKEHFDFYKLLGIEFSDFSLLSDVRPLIKVLNHALAVHDNLSQRLAREIKIFNPFKDLKKYYKYTELVEVNDKKVSKDKFVNPIRSILRDILKFEGSISNIAPTLVTKAANGENQSDITYSNAISIAANQINESKSLEDLYTKPYFKKIKYNPLHNKSFVASRVIGNSNMAYQIENYSGHTTVEDEDSVSSDTRNLSDIDKFISDLNNLLGWGVINTPQLESKAGYFALKFFDKNANRAILPFSHDEFVQDFLIGSSFTSQITQYLYGEIERVRSYDSVKAYAPASYGEFHIFKNFVTPELKADLLKIKSSLEYKKAEETVLKGLNNYFNEELKTLNAFIKKNEIKNFVSAKVLTDFNINKEVFKDNQEAYENSLLRTFIANDFIHNVEFGIFISGDPLFYKDYHKRLGGLSSTGTQPVSTNNLKQLFNSDEEKIFWDNFSLRGILNQLTSENKKVERRSNFDTFLSAVLSENLAKENTEYQNPATIDNYIKSVKLNTGKTITRDQAREDLKLKIIEEEGISVGDGQGYLNLDAARELSIKQGTYRPQQDDSYRFEALIFKQILLEESGQKLSDSDFKLLKKYERRILKEPNKYALPTLKQTYYGTLSNESVKIDAKVFDKFSLAILLPSTARNHPELKKLLLAMAKRQIHYVKYKSGTKGFVRKTFTSLDELANESNELDELESNLLKLQITPSKVEKTSTKIPTQKIKLLFTNLFSEGQANESVKAIRDKFLGDLENIKNYNRKSILEQLGFKTNEYGKITSWDKNKIIEALVSQVNLQKLPTPLLEALETDSEGNFVNNIESSNIYQQLLNYVTGKLDSTLREFKVNGGDFVLLSESMFSEPLQYFRLNKNGTKILPCDCRITLTKEYVKMLDLPDMQDKSKTIGTIERLNQLLKNPRFVAQYEKELTIAFSRPPVQGPNSMGVAIIKEFFYPTAGNILQLPKEFMHQAGIDFDYDKEKVLIPSLTKDGLLLSNSNITERIKQLDNQYFELKEIYDYYEDNVIKPEDVDSYEEYTNIKNELLGNDEYTKVLSKLLKIDFENIPEKLNEIEGVINEYFLLKYQEKAMLSNTLFQGIIDSLQQPEIYSELILPNSNDKVRPLAISNGTDINNLNSLPQGIDVYSYMQNLKVFKLFNDAKALLGPFALHNVFMELIAPLDIKINLDYAINDKKEPTRRINLLLLPKPKDGVLPRTVNISSRYDVNGNVKQHMTSEFINATVDSAKDPYFANFMLSFNNINTFTFLMALHYPIETIVDFTSSAVVRRYLDLKNRNKDLTKEQIIKKVLSEISPKPLKGDVSMTAVFEVDTKGIDKDHSDLISKLKEFKNDNSLDNKENYMYLATILCNFIAMEEHAREFGNFKNLFKNDTNKTSSLYEISSKQFLRNRVISSGMFLNEDIEKVENQSTMTAFRNDDLIGEVLKTVFPIMSNPIVSRELGNLFNEAKPSLKEIDKRILSQVITNDYITNILFTFATYKDENIFQYGRKLVSKSKNKDGTLNTTLLERIYKFKKNKAYPDLVKAFPVLEKILAETSENPLKGNYVYGGQYAYNTLLNIDPNIPILEKESFMGQFKQIIEGEFETDSPQVKTALIGLVKDFFIAGLIQSGFNKGGISYMEYAPVKFIQELLNPALKIYNFYEKNDPRFFEAFVKNFTQFGESGIVDNLFKINNPKYFYFQKGDRRYINRSSHLGKYLHTPYTVTENVKEAIKNSTDPKDFINNSGGAIGSDITWDNIGKEFGVINHKHYWMDEKTPHGNVEISKEDAVEGQQKATIAARQMGRIAPTHQVRDTKLIRNWSQVKYSDSIFAIGSFYEAGDEMKYTKKAQIKQVKGGTGYAVQMAINEGKNVYVFDQENKQWFQFVDGKWAAITTPILTTKFAGVGTREINEAGKQAIRDVYTNTFGNLSNTTKEVKKEKTINIYSTDKNGFESLSNMTIRPFRYDFGGGYTDFTSVEQAYQAAKYEYSEQSAVNEKIEEKILDSNPFDARKLGKTFKGFNREIWDENSSRIMKKFLLESFKQNPDALEKLLSTGNAQLTHTQDNSKWATEFPRLLMEVRNELKVDNVNFPIVQYKDRENRIRIDYPNIIKTNSVYHEFDSNKLLEIRSVFDGRDDGTIEDQREFKTGEGDDWLTEYGMTNRQYEYAKNNERILANLLEVGSFEWEDIELTTIEDVINRLLSENEKLVDIAQLSLFDQEQLNDIGFKKTCN